MHANFSAHDSINTEHVNKSWTNMNESSAHREDDSAVVIGPCSNTLSWDNALCNSCRDLFDLVLARHERACSTTNTVVRSGSARLSHSVPFHGRNKIKRCAALGCKLCEAFMGDVEAEPPSPNGNLCRVEVSVVGTFGQLAIYDNAQDPSLSLSLNFLSRKTNSWDTIGPGEHTGSDETMQLVNEWLMKCEDHQKCDAWRKRDAPRTLPTRLIEMSGNWAAPVCRLVDSTSLPQPLEYATISYRWGDFLPLLCKKDNIDVLHQQIEWDMLPRTFQEAICATQKIGLCYIWIDAMCIIQDDPKDWAYESGTMATVYSNSFLNLSADASANADGGLFRKRGSMADFIVVDSERFPVLTCHRHSVVHDRIWDAYRSSHLRRRGWVIQERILAPRTLYFGSEFVHLVCLEATEVDYAGPSRHVESALSYERPHELWNNIIQRYAPTETTYESDRTIALAGLAEKVCSLLSYRPSDYLCGLWKATFIQSLIWQTHSARKVNTGDGTPSWSWLLWRGWIFFKTSPDNSREVAQFLTGVTVPAAASPFGPVASAHVRVKGPLCEILLQANLQRPEEYSVTIGAVTVPIGPQENTDVMFHFDSPPAQDNAETQSSVYLLLCTCSETTNRRLDTVQPWTSLRGSEFWSAYTTYTHLLLRPTEVPGHFCRIGLATLIRQGTDVIPSTDLRAVLDRHFRSDHISLDSYYEKDEHFIYTITLV